MALREFRDANGVEWRVWATIPAAAALVKVASGSLGNLEGGWLTFECVDGRKRLAPFPSNWDTLPDAELERFCGEAKAPPPRRVARPASASSEAGAARGSTDLTALDPSTPARTFTGASGRLWRVTEHERVAGREEAGVARASAQFVLRFTSDSEVLELTEYPMAWARLADAQLLRLIRQAERVRGG